MIDPIKKQIVIDENSQPIAVIISYQDWQKIEAFLGENDTSHDQSNDVEDISKQLKALVGSLKLTIDPLEYQGQIRNEWL